MTTTTVPRSRRPADPGRVLSALGSATALAVLIWLAATDPGTEPATMPGLGDAVALACAAAGIFYAASFRWTLADRQRKLIAAIAAAGAASYPGLCQTAAAVGCQPTAAVRANCAVLAALAIIVIGCVLRR